MSDGYQFVQIGSCKDRTFNRLLAINNNGRIAGYRGSGATGHPNQGYTISAPYAQRDIKGENFPKSAGSEVTGLNDVGVQVGIEFPSGGGTVGWYFNGSFHKVAFPTNSNEKPPRNELLGVNNNDTVVGAYLDATGGILTYHGLIWRIGGSLGTGIDDPNGLGVSIISGINDEGDIAGYYLDSGGSNDGFIAYPAF